MWSTREQQAQKLLDSRQPARAAPLFGDARRRGYAELEAGQFDKAAKSLAPFKDADSQYNRGNALAHTGQLREALSAYDAALAASPGNKDVIRNRELVARALKQQQQAQSGQQGGSKGQPGSQGSKGGQSQGGDHSPGGGQPQPGDSSQANNQGQRGGGQSQSNQANPSQQANQAQGNQSQGSPSQANNQGQRNGPSPQGQSQANSQAQAGQSQGGQQGGGASPGGSQAQAGQSPGTQAGGQSPGQQSQANTPRPGDNAAGEGALAANGQQTNGQTGAAGLNAENAQQDANAALRYRQSQQGRSAPDTNPSAPNNQASVLGGDGKAARSSAEVPPPEPPSEQAMALDQWLRGIPDDSAELLRRKFLIEHMLKQQQRDQL